MIQPLLRVVSNDDHLLHDLQRGDADWTSFEARFGSYLKANASRLRTLWRADVEDRRDALQETYLYLIDPERPRFDPARGAATTYLYFALETAFHRVLDRRRSAASYEEAADELMTPARQERYEDVEFVEHVLADLSPADRALFNDVANDRTILELSRERGVSRPTMSRAVQRLRDRVQGRAAEALCA